MDRYRQSKYSRWMRLDDTPAAPQLGLEAAQHPLRATHEHRELARIAVGDTEDMLGREATVDARVDHVHVQGLMAVGDLADLLGERRIPVRAVEEVDAIRAADRRRARGAS